MSFSKTSFLQDRFTQGTIAGALGWFPQAVFTIGMHALHLTKLRYLDFAGVLAFNHKPNGLWESLLAEVVVVIFQAALGGVFAWWIKGVESLNMFGRDFSLEGLPGLRYLRLPRFISCQGYILSMQLLRA